MSTPHNQHNKKINGLTYDKFGKLIKNYAYYKQQSIEKGEYTEKDFKKPKGVFQGLRVVGGPKWTSSYKQPCNRD